MKRRKKGFIVKLTSSIDSYCISKLPGNGTIKMVRQLVIHPSELSSFNGVEDQVRQGRIPIIGRDIPKALPKKRKICYSLNQISNLKQIWEMEEMEGLPLRVHPICTLHCDKERRIAIECSCLLFGSLGCGG